MEVITKLAAALRVLSVLYWQKTDNESVCGVRVWFSASQRATKLLRLLSFEMLLLQLAVLMPRDRLCSCCSQASFIPPRLRRLLSPGPQQPVDVPCQPRFLVSPNDDAFCVGHILNALGDIGSPSVCVLICVCLSSCCQWLPV